MGGVGIFISRSILPDRRNSMATASMFVAVASTNTCLSGSCSGRYNHKLKSTIVTVRYYRANYYCARRRTDLYCPVNLQHEGGEHLILCIGL